MRSEPFAVCRGAVALIPFFAAGCSFLAPSDAELVGGSPRKEGGVSGARPPSDAGRSNGADAPSPIGSTVPVDPFADASSPSLDAGSVDSAVRDASRCDAECGAPKPPCSSDPNCIAPGQPLRGLRLELHCGAQDGTSDSCKMVLPTGTSSCPKEGLQVHRTVSLGGDAGKLYRVTLRFRGVVEPKAYGNGTPDVANSNGQFYKGGAGAGDPIYNTYGITVSEPSQDYFLNNWTEGMFVLALDYEETLTVRGDAQITLYGYTKLCALSYDCADLSAAPDCSPKVLSGVAHLPDKGQFIQLDVESVLDDPTVQ